MPNPSRLAGRFFCFLMSLSFAVLLPRTAVASEAVSPAASLPELARLHSGRFAGWPTARRFTPADELLVAAPAPATSNPRNSGSGLTLCQIVEGIFGSKSGANKKAAALSFVQTAVSATDAMANKNIVDANKFQDGLSKVIDGVVQCLNASVWAGKN